MEKIDSRSLLVAGPTSGKSFLIRLLQGKGLTVADTDVTTELLMPDYFRLKIWKHRDATSKLVNHMRDIICAWDLQMNGSKLVLTNLWSETFLQHVLPTGKRKAWLYVMRANPLEMTLLSKSRGHAISTSLTSKWVNNTEQYAHRVFEHVLWLPENVYLSDVVTANKDGWYLTEMGKALIGKSRSEALSIKRKDLTKEGGSHE